MVQIKEFRIVMPLSLEEYQVAQMYMVLRMQQQSKTSTEGVEILEDRPLEDNVFGKCQYISKVYQLQSKVPAWLTAFASQDALVVQEEAWNAYPRCKSVIKSPCFNKLLLTIETFHKADNGRSENVHGLNKEQLAARQVEVIDIASSARDCWSYLIGNSNVNLSQFKSAKTGRGPLLQGWQDQHNPVMTAYKLVIIDAPYWGFGNRLEQTLLAGERALFLESHRSCFTWIDEWFGMTEEAIRELERGSPSSLNEATYLGEFVNIMKWTSSVPPEKEIIDFFQCLLSIIHVWDGLTANAVGTYIQVVDVPSFKMRGAPGLEDL